MTNRKLTSPAWLAIALFLIALPLTSEAQKYQGDSTKVDYNEFKDPPGEFRGTRWFT